jgi:hypothetical protein
VLVRFVSPDPRQASVSLSAEEVERGVYRLGGGYVDRAGAWRIEVTARRPGQPDAIATFDWPVRSSVPPPPAVLSTRPLAPLLTAAAIGVGLLTALGATAWRLRRRLFPTGWRGVARGRGAAVGG